MSSANKYGAVKAERDGITFASKAERRRYDELRLLEYEGEITDLRVQPEYVLQEAFKRDGKTIRPIVYRADFAYRENGRQIAEDVKGVATAVFKLKYRLFLKRYPEIDLRIVE